VRESRYKLLMGGNALVHGPQFVIVERDILAQPQQVRLAFQQQRLAGPLRQVVVAARAGHPVRALVEEVVGAVAVPEVVVLPRFVGRPARPDRILVDQHFDRAQVGLVVTTVPKVPI